MTVAASSDEPPKAPPIKITKRRDASKKFYAVRTHAIKTDGKLREKTPSNSNAKTKGAASKKSTNKKRVYSIKSNSPQQGIEVSKAPKGGKAKRKAKRSK
jgi:hypothetical protein